MSNKKKNQNRISPGEERLQIGISIYNKHPLFSKLYGTLHIYGKQNMGKETAAIVRSTGEIFLNKDALLSPNEWAYTIAHCKLHLAFGHFDAEKMPGYEKELSDGSTRWMVSCNKELWNIACDIYVSKFLYDVKFGTPTCANPISSFSGNLSDERKIYQYLIEHGSSEQNHIFGTASSMDMQGLESPLEYDSKKNQKNKYMINFVYALAYSVSDVISEAGGHETITKRTYTKSEKAAQWFINHYPLLGGLAAGFKIIEDYQLCIQEEISIAAIYVTEGIICVNPAAALSENELKFVLAHEFLHAGLCHHERCQGRDPYLWNIACDYVINGWLHDMYIGEMPERGLLYDENLKNISVETLYDQMIKDLKKYSKLDTFRGYGKGDVITKSNNHTFSKPSSTSLDEFYKNALQNGLEYHNQTGRGYIPAGLIEEIRALSMPPIPWDVALGIWFDYYFAPLEKHYTYARPSRRQGSTPTIPRPNYVRAEIPEHSRTFGVVIDTSGSMSAKLIGYALGAIASYAVAKEVPFARVIFCDADAYDAGYLSPEDIAGRVQVRGRGGTCLQPGIDLLQSAKDFPKDGPILIITDGYIEEHMSIQRDHAFLIPKGRRLPFLPKGKVFYFSETL